MSSDAQDGPTSTKGPARTSGADVEKPRVEGRPLPWRFPSERHSVQFTAWAVCPQPPMVKLLGALWPPGWRVGWVAVLRKRPVFLSLAPRLPLPGAQSLHIVGPQSPCHWPPVSPYLVPSLPIIGPQSPHPWSPGSPSLVPRLPVAGPWSPHRSSTVSPSPVPSLPIARPQSPCRWSPVSPSLVPRLAWVGWEQCFQSIWVPSVSCWGIRGPGRKVPLSGRALLPWLHRAGAAGSLPCFLPWHRGEGGALCVMVSWEGPGGAMCKTGPGHPCLAQLQVLGTLPSGSAGTVWVPGLLVSWPEMQLGFTPPYTGCSPPALHSV